MSLTSIATYIYTVLLKQKHIRRLTNAILLSVVVRESVTIKEGILYLNQKDVVISSALALGVYEPFQIEVFRSLLSSSMTVVDIGANIGLYTVIAAKKAGKVFSFEPESENIALLNKNVRENGLANVQTFQKAVADTEGTQEFFISNNNKGSHSLFTPPDTFEKGTVETISLDAWAAQNHIDNIDLIKIDVQGAEFLVLKGMKKILARHPTILIEYDPDMLASSGGDPINILEDFKSLGYTIHNISETYKKLELVSDIQSLRESLRGRKFTNLLIKH